MDILLILIGYLNPVDLSVEAASLVSNNLIDFNTRRQTLQKAQDVRQISWSNKYVFDRWNLLAWALFNLMIQNRPDICVDVIFRPATQNGIDKHSEIP